MLKNTRKSEVVVLFLWRVISETFPLPSIRLVHLHKPSKIDSFNPSQIMIQYHQWTIWFGLFL